MLKRRVACTVLILLFLSGIVFSFRIEWARADSTIYIKSDGSIIPTGSPISTTDNITYTLTGNVSSSGNGIMVQRNNTIIDGNGYTLRGSGGLTGISITDLCNVTTRNFNVVNFTRDIDVYFSSNITLSDNNLNDRTGADLWSSFDCIVSNNSFTGISRELRSYGVALESSSGNILSGNNITEFQYGLYFWDSSTNTVVQNNFFYNYLNVIFWSSSGNRFFHNNFLLRDCVAVSERIFNHDNLTNIWDNGFEGNYWCCYNGTDSNHDGIGDPPYIIDASDRDLYPLVTQYVVPEFTSFLVLSLFMIATLLAMIICRRKHLT